MIGWAFFNEKGKTKFEKEFEKIINYATMMIYQTSEGALELKTDWQNETIWASLEQIATLFGRNKSTISRHIKNILREGELIRDSTVAVFATVQKEGQREVTRDIENFNLDMIISVGYRVNSKIATQFRQWATKILKQHITQGFTINKNRIKQNQQAFLQQVEDIKQLTQNNKNIQTTDILELIKSFAPTWFSLDRFDKNVFPNQEGTKKDIQITTENLQNDLQQLKQELITKKEATTLFAEEKRKGNLQGIIGNVFQSVFGKDAYETLEEKAAHLLYFIIKDHPFTDGNKRSAAFAFIWFLQKAEYHFREKINPETLTTLTILIAASEPEKKEKMIGIILLILNCK